MVHNTQDVTFYHDSDARYLRTTVEDQQGDPVNLTDASAEWLLFASEGDPDAEAVLTKETPSGIDILDPPSNGQLRVRINTDDTAGLVDSSTTDDLETDFYHRLRVSDASGRRVTVFTGTFTLHW